MGKPPGVALGPHGFRRDEVAATGEEDDRPWKVKLIKEGVRKAIRERAECPPRTSQRDQSAPEAFRQQTVDAPRIGLRACGAGVE
jgi:hypothetical protein